MPNTTSQPGTLELDRLVVGFAETPLLQAVSASVAPGEVLGVPGPSGCGKTTLLRTVAGLIDPVSGSLSLGGRTPEQLGYPPWRRRVLYLSQVPVLPEITVLANLRRVFDYRHVEGRFDRDRAEAMLSTLRLEPEVLEDDARRLSVGQRQRICLARALLIEPHVLLLDEPTSALDDASEAAVAEVLATLVDQRRLALVAALHDSRRLAGMVQRRIELVSAVDRKAGVS